MNDRLNALPAMARRAACPRTYGRTLRLGQAGRDDAGRAELERYVCSAFARKHAASIQTFMPSLLGFRDGEGRLRGVVGLRNAAMERLYLEQYLDVPVESAVASATGRVVRRDEIVEAGNLAGGNCRAAVRMIAQLPTYLMAQDLRWIVFTATSTIRQILLGFGAPLVELARADGTRITSGVDAWGSYYDTDPRVFAGYLPDSWRVPGFDHGEQDH